MSDGGRAIGCSWVPAKGSRPLLLTGEPREALQTRRETLPTGFGAVAESWQGEKQVERTARLVSAAEARQIWGSAWEVIPSPSQIWLSSSLGIPLTLSATNKQQERQEAEGSASPTAGRGKQCGDLSKTPRVL